MIHGSLYIDNITHHNISSIIILIFNIKYQNIKYQNIKISNIKILKIENVHSLLLLLHLTYLT
jgi:hypothetical protein